MKKVLFSATVDAHILAFHIPFLKYFKEQGYEVHVATNGTEEIPYCDKKIIIPFERSPFKINNLKAIKELRKVIQKEHYDIIHTHTPMGSVVTRLAAKKARRNGTRVIYTAHGFHFFKGAPLLNWCLFYPVEKYLSKYTDTLILINQEDYQRAKKKFRKCKDIKYVPGVGIDEEKFDFQMSEKEKLELRKSLGLKKDDFVLIYPAELNKNKNQILLIEAMEQLVKKYPNIKLLLPGKDSYHGYYQKIVAEKNLCDHIFFLGFRKDIPELLKISDLAVASSLREGLPVNIMEAMHVGLPVIATNCRGQRDLVEDEKTGYLVGYNGEEFASKIIDLYHDQKKYKRFSNFAYDQSNSYMLSDILDRMSKIYGRKKRVLHLLASNQFSGAENVACTIIEKLKDDFDLYYCSVDGKIRDVLAEKKIKFIPLESFSYKNLKKIISKYNPDIIHAHDFKASILVSFVKPKCKIIAHIHKNDPNMKKISVKSLLFFFRSHRFAKIIGVSDSVFDEYVFKKRIKKIYITLPNYIDKSYIISKSLEPTTDNEQFDLCFFGRLSKEKNPLYFIRIILYYKKRFCNDVTACIIGTGPLFEECKSVIKELSLEENITLYGFQSNPYSYLKKCKCVIMPSLFEGFGLTAIESMILEIPVLNSGVGGLKAIFINEPSLICKSLEEYAEKAYNYIHKNNMINYTKIYSKYVDFDTWKKCINSCYK